MLSKHFNIPEKVTLGLMSLIVTPLLFFGINFMVAEKNMEREYNRIKTLPENKEIVEKYRFYGGLIPPLLSKAAQNEIEKLEKRDGIMRAITSEQVAYLHRNYNPEVFIGQYP